MKVLIPAKGWPIQREMARILVIEDDSGVRDLLEKVLAATGYEVSTAVNGEEGVLCFRKKPPDLVITDLLMPNKEGLETIRELRLANPVVKIVAISGAPSEWRALEIATKLGANETISKPFKTDDLLHAVERLLKVC